MAIGKQTDQVQVLDPDPSSLCVTGHRPYILTGVFVWLCITHFSSEHNIVDGDLRAHQWRPEDMDAGVVNGIQIQALTKWNPAQIQYRPAIYVKRNGIKPVRLSIGDKLHGTGGRVASPGIRANAYYSMLDGGAQFETLLAGSHTLFCIAETGLAAEKLGAEVFYRCLEFSERIRDDLGFYRFRPMELGPVQKLEEDKEHWVAPVVLSHVTNHAWVLRLEAPVLKGVSIETLTTLGG